MSIKELTKDKFFNSKEACESTIKNILRAANIISRALPSLYTRMRKKHIAQRLIFARNHKNWTRDDWELVIFSDESDFFPTKTGKKYYRTKGKAIHPDPKQLCREIHSNITIKVWGIVSYWGVGPLIRYTDTVKDYKYITWMETHLLSEYPELQGAAWFQEEQAPFILWTINIVENIWLYLQNELYQISHTLRSPEDTWRETQKIWHSIQLRYIQELYKSLPGRMKKVFEKRGGPIA